MTRDEVYAHLRQILLEHFEVPSERIAPSARLLEDLELDSIDAIDIAVHIQELVKVRVEERDLRELRTVEDAVELVMALRAQRAQ